MMTENEWQATRSHLIIMRVWAEDLGEGKLEWRGRVQHSPGGNTQYFRDLKSLAPLIESMLAQAPAMTEPEASARSETEHRQD